ncbi:phage head-tail adaptor, putative, SPP1 family [Acidovorax sp. CF316]|uniref:phage head closure protein n=1 Tax=Acidovorax sp. CF316 TaxID=1144317 RepID=UPI00026BC7EE|nr:phage head closure protein [Acidovorax sp. CF316]EJE49579.1 phage head-tail adaptor, putative, SPP1 family [Acidovorax sp. CF316]
MLRAGSLNRRITIQRRNGGKDAWGTPLPDGWVDVCTPWSNIRTGSGAEAIRADALQSAVRTSIRIRFRADITAGMRVVHGAAIYDIKAVLPDEVGRQHVDLACELVT